MHEFRPHWINYLFVFLSSFLGFTFIIVTIPVYLILGCFLLGYALYRFIETYTVEYTLTNKRIISKKGFVFVKSEELKNAKVEAVEIKQSILGRILGYGNVHMSGTGTSQVWFSNIVNPYMAKQKIEEVIGD